MHEVPGGSTHDAPLSSNCGRPARPKICCTSSMPTSLKPPFWASYTWGPAVGVGGGRRVA